jgi:hypothetical protein
MCSCVDWLHLPLLASICLNNQVPQLPKAVVCWWFFDFMSTPTLYLVSKEVYCIQVFFVPNVGKPLAYWQICTLSQGCV